MRDITPTETVAEMTIVPSAHVSLAAGVVVQPKLDAAFRARANAACQATQVKLAHLPGFPFGNFDPLQPDKSTLAKLGQFFSGAGDARPALRALQQQLAALGMPPAAKPLWARVLASRREDLAVRDEQIRAALNANVPAFVASVHASGKSGVTLALLATAFGVDSCTS